MREPPSGGVGSIQDQGVNYIQLNIQPSTPLLNTELRNATLNKDYERWTPLDRAQLTARPGRPWPPARTRWRSGGGSEVGARSGPEPARPVGSASGALPFRPQPQRWRSRPRLVQRRTPPRPAPPVRPAPHPTCTRSAEPHGRGCPGAGGGGSFRGGRRGTLGGAWLSFRAEGAGGKGRPRGGPGGAQPVAPGARRAGAGMTWRGWLAPGAPPTGGGPRGEPQSPPELSCESGGGEGQEARRWGEQGPAAAAPSSLLPAQGACPASLRPSRARGPSPAWLPALPGHAAAPSPGRERASARGCCSNEKSEQLNRKIWIKKLEFNTHAPHLLKH